MVQVLSKLIEATTDALFNFPAMLTAQSWTKFAPAYLYRFEHVGKSGNRGSIFLSGLPIVGNKNPANNTVAYGDELTYLFDARDIFGKPLQNLKPLDATDRKVRDTFSNIITQFAYLSGNNSRSVGASVKGLFDIFNPQKNNYIKIGDNTVLDKDFR